MVIVSSCAGGWTDGWGAVIRLAVELAGRTGEMAGFTVWSGGASAGALCSLGLVGPLGVAEDLGDVGADELFVDGGHGVLLEVSCRVVGGDQATRV
jgi:hypothetical protein